MELIDYKFACRFLQITAQANGFSRPRKYGVWELRAVLEAYEKGPRKTNQEVYDTWCRYLWRFKWPRLQKLLIENPKTNVDALIETHVNELEQEQEHRGFRDETIRS